MSAQWRDMTQFEKRLCEALDPARVRYPVASPPKRLGRDLAAQAKADPPQITDKQAAAAWAQAWRFRRQIPDAQIRLYAEAVKNAAARSPQ